MQNLQLSKGDILRNNCMYIYQRKEYPKYDLQSHDAPMQVSIRATTGAGRRQLTSSKGLARAGCMAFPTAIPNQVIKSVTITSTKEEIPVEGRITCSTKNFLYMLWSSKDPDSQY